MFTYLFLFWSSVAFWSDAMVQDLLKAAISKHFPVYWRPFRKMWKHTDILLISFSLVLFWLWLFFYSVPVLPGYRSLVLSYFQKVFRLVFHVPCLFVLISSRGFWEFFWPLFRKCSSIFLHFIWSVQVQFSVRCIFVTARPIGSVWISENWWIHFWMTSSSVFSWYWSVHIWNLL